MSDQLVNIPRERFEELAAAPLRLSQVEAARLMQAGDVDGANRRLAQGVSESAAIRSQFGGQQPATLPTTPAAAAPVVPPAAPVPGAPLASPGTPPPVVAPPVPPTEQLPGESLGQFYLRRGAALRQATQMADGRFDLSRPMGLLGRR